MTEIIVFGASDLAEVVDYYLSHEAGHRVVAFTVDGEYMGPSNFLGRPVIAFEELRTKHGPERYKMLIAIGYRRINEIRAKKYRAAKTLGYQFISLISERAAVARNVVLGDNCIVLENNTIQPYARIGADVVMLSGNLVSHHTTIGDHCFLAGGCVIGGRVTVGTRCFIGLNATVRNHMALGEGCVVGAGAVMLKHGVAGGVYRGQPASRLRRKSFSLDDL